MLLPWTTSRSPSRPGPAREGELAFGRDVCADALLVQQPEQRDVRECLRAEEHAAVVSERGAECARVRAHRFLAQHDEWRPVLLGEGFRGEPTDRERGTFESHGIREQR